MPERSGHKVTVTMDTVGGIYAEVLAYVTYMNPAGKVTLYSSHSENLVVTPELEIAMNALIEDNPTIELAFDKAMKVAVNRC